MEKTKAPDGRLPEKIGRLRSVLARSKSVCVLTGAGVSAESGVPVYRGNEGLYRAFSAAEVATPEGFARDPERVWQWYNDRRRQLLELRPNAGHVALAALERQVEARAPGGFRLVTQNIDGLHQAAGSRKVWEVHGNIWQDRCTGCGQVTDRRGQVPDGVPRCGACGQLCRPHIVWFGEMLPQEVWAAAVEAASTSAVFLAVGTSAVVQPVASLARLANDSGALVAEVNLEETPNSRWVGLSLLGKAGDILPGLVE